MRTGDDDFLIAEDDEADFRRTLALFGEPAPSIPPPDFVTRTTHRLPPIPPAAAARQQRRRRLIRLTLGVLVLTMALFGIWSQLAGPTQPLLGAGDTGISRSLLMLQLALKPLVGSLGGLALPLLAIGASAALGARIIAQRADRLVRNSQLGT